MLILKCCATFLFYSLFPLAVFSGAAAFPLQRATSRFALRRCVCPTSRATATRATHQCSYTWNRICTRRLGAHPHTTVKSRLCVPPPPLPPLATLCPVCLRP